MKDLSRITGNLNVVYNCSDEMDIASLLKIFVGVVRCGAWLCLDEFNRLEEGVLSVLGTYIQALQIELANPATKVSTYITASPGKNDHPRS